MTFAQIFLRMVIAPVLRMVLALIYCLGFLTLMILAFDENRRAIFWMARRLGLSA
jgi:hypothetical protein